MKNKQRLFSVFLLALPMMTLAQNKLADSPEKPRPADETAMINEPAPSFILKDLDGKTVSLQSLKGKTLILDFWATWCGPCKASFPAMAKVVTDYKDNPDVKFLFVDAYERHATNEEKLKAVSNFIASNKYPFQVLLDNDNKVADDYKAYVIPCKFIIDKNGNIRYKVVGVELDAEKLAEELKVMIESVK
ncbi:MAG: TlpA disulfide reductase family protein [Ginsengibacter sp.]